VVRIAFRCVIGEDQVRDARLEVVQEAAHRRRALLFVALNPPLGTWAVGSGEKNDSDEEGTPCQLFVERERRDTLRRSMRYMTGVHCSSVDESPRKSGR